MISNTKIDKIGQKIKADDDLTRQENEILLEWRNSFIPTLDYYHKRIIQKIDPKTIAAIGKRLKRIPSIHKKLKRSKTLRLSSMQDIAGLRIVLKNQNDLHIAVNSIRSSQSKNIFKKMQDYDSRPKDDGYRSIHLIYQSRSENRLIEIQFRTELQHIWATAVEVYGTINLISFKTGEGDHEWKEFFKLLSSYFAITENGRVLEEHRMISKSVVTSKLKKKLKKLKIIERLATIKNSIEVVVKSHSRGKWGKYALVELDTTTGQTSVDIYSNKDLTSAIKIYTKREFEIKHNPNINIVFANIESLEELKVAYPNYFLDTDKLIRILGKISLDQPIFDTYS